MSLQTYTVRQYASDDTFSHLNNLPFWAKEIQVVIASARDCDPDGKPTNGVFHPHWNTEKVISTTISDYKKFGLPPKVKFFLTIGGRDSQFIVPDPGQKASWVSNATQSLTAIIQEYNFDGLDISYENIIGDHAEFVDIMKRLIPSLIAYLKKHIPKITPVFSISPTASLNDTCYVLLYKQCQADIGTVVYQCYTVKNPINDAQELRNHFASIANQYKSGEKLLAGYSAQLADRTTVSVPVYYGAILTLLEKKLVYGTSIWTVSDESVTGLATSFKPQSPEAKGKAHN